MARRILKKKWELLVLLKKQFYSISKLSLMVIVYLKFVTITRWRWTTLERFSQWTYSLETWYPVLEHEEYFHQIVLLLYLQNFFLYINTRRRDGYNFSAPPVTKCYKRFLKLIVTYLLTNIILEYGIMIQTCHYK